LDNGKERTQRVKLAGKDEKQQLIDVFGGSMTGHFLLYNLSIKGRHSSAFQKVKFPADWDVTFSENHWSNKQTMTNYLEKVLIPYIKRRDKNCILQASILH